MWLVNNVCIRARIVWAESESSSNLSYQGRKISMGTVVSAVRDSVNKEIVLLFVKVNCG
jgi:hypothetical protein